MGDFFGNVFIDSNKTCPRSLLALGDCSCITENQLPATAQVASQQGEFLAKLFSRLYDLKGGR